MDDEKSNNQVIEVLFLEENPKDVKLIKKVLEKNKYYPINLHICMSLKEALNFLKLKHFDLLLLGSSCLSDKNKEQKIIQLLEIAPKISMVLYTDKESLELFRWCFYRGISYVKKDEYTLKTLPRIIYYLLAQRKTYTTLKSVCENIADSILLINNEGKILFCNRATEKLLGYSQKELIGTYFGYPVSNYTTLEIDLPNRLGGPGTGEMRISENIIDGEKCYIVAIRDITEQKKVSNALVRESKTNAIIAEVCRKLLVVPTLESAAEIILEQAKAVTNSRIGYVGIIDKETGYFNVLAITTNVWDKCKSVNKELIFKKFSGLWGWVLKNRKPLLSNDPQKHPASSGTPSGHIPIERFLSVPALVGNELVGQISVANASYYQDHDLRILQQFADIFSLTIQRFQNEKALHAAKEAAEKALQVKERFLSNISHEIRTPLNAILGFSQLLANDSTLTPKQRSYIETINKAGEHLLNLINDILDFSKIELGKMKLTPAKFCLHDTLKTVEAMFRSSAEEKGLELVVEVDKTVPRYVIADEGKIRQILINLLGNAVKFTEQGRIVLRVHAETPKEPSGEVRIIVEIEDTGHGIPEEHLEKIFESFEHADSGAVTEGTGLGLSICKRLVKMMDGNISVRSKLGKGTCFCFDVVVQPIEEGLIEDLKPRHAPVIGLAADTGSVRALVVDDNQESRFILESLLKRIGIEVKQAKDGQEALDYFKRFLPDVVFMDIRMPVMDGLEAIRKIRNTEHGKHTTIIVVAAAVSEHVKQRAVRAGADAYITKPFKEDEIFSSLERLIGLRFRRGDKKSMPPSKIIPLEEQKSLARLPKEFILAIRKAVEEGDVEHLEDLLEQIRQTDPIFAQKLQNLVDKYDYGTLIKMFEKIKD